METATQGSKKMSSYRLYTKNKTDYTTKATSPAKALRELCKMAGLELATQDGRYGKLTDGTSAAAMTEKWSRAHYADHGTTRL
jgi:hypothetical protein